MDLKNEYLEYKSGKLVYTGDEEVDAFLDECFDTMRSKGHDYREGNDADLVHNFRTVGEDLDLPMEKIWLVYASKHWKAIKTYIKEGGASESEPIEGRIKDVIVYLLLLYKMIQERKTSQNLPKSKGIVEDLIHELEKQTRDVPGNDPKLFTKTERKILDGVKVEVENPTQKGPVRIENGRLILDTQRLHQLSGLPGVFFDPEILSRGGQIINKLLERDQTATENTPRVDHHPYPEQYEEYFKALYLDAIKRAEDDFKRLKEEEKKDENHL